MESLFKVVLEGGATSLLAGTISECFQLLGSSLTDNGMCLRDKYGPTLFREKAAIPFPISSIYRFLKHL